MTNPGVQMTGIHKSFGGVRALRGASLCVAPGECHALVGANGAGKSTLARILAGSLQPDAGQVSLSGVTTHLRSSHDGMAAGVGMVPQEPLLALNMTVAENVMLGREQVRGGRLDRTGNRIRTADLLRRVGLAVDPEAPASALNVAQQQLVQVARALGCDARVLILDEPTSSITAHESERLFALMDQLRDRGVTIIYVSHRLAEVFRLSDRVTVMRDGVDVATHQTARTTPDAIIAEMAGATQEILAEAAQHEPATHAEGPPPLLEAAGLTRSGEFEDINLRLWPGEILGIAGLVGAGRSELAQSLAGLGPPDAGTVSLDGTPVSVRNAEEALKHGIVLVPEDRKLQGLIPQLTVRENISLNITWEMAGAWGRISRSRDKAIAEEYREALSIHCSSVEQEVRELSGGNQQKVLLARALACRPRVLILDEPTRGVDVRAKADIHRWVRELARERIGSVLISSELEEVLDLSDRIVVMREGRAIAEMPAAGLTEEQLLRYAAGAESTAMT